MSIQEKTATELIQLMTSGEISSVEITQKFLDCVEDRNPEINAFVRWDRERALREAASIDERRGRGEDVGRLGGLPIAIKDNLCTTHDVTSCGSMMLSRYRSPYDATVVRNIKSAGGVILGKTNMDEFAMGASTETSSFGPTHNPWDTSRIPGGSSGGSAASVAALMTPLAVGTDTGGSIRQPSAHCGVVGLKPTYGRVSRYGLIAFGSSLDCIGPIARSADDAALLLSVLAGRDPRDATSLAASVPNYMEDCAKPLDSVRLGMVEEQFGEGMSPEVRAHVKGSLEVFERLGATIENVSLPHSRYAIAAYYIIAPSEASSNLARYDGAHYGHRTENIDEFDEDGPLVSMYCKTRQEGFGPEVKRRIMLGTYSLSAGYYDAYYLKALKMRRLISEDFKRAFEQVDFLIGPVTPTAAFRLGEKMQDPLAMYLGDSYTVGANLAGLPAISLPCGISDQGVPVGVHLQGPGLSEHRLLQLASAYQRESKWHLKRPS